MLIFKAILSLDPGYILYGYTYQRPFRSQKVVYFVFSLILHICAI